MSETRPFLLELGVEEIPHWMIDSALESLRGSFAEVLEKSGLQAATLRMDGTPRRLVLRADALPERQQDRVELVMGPPKAAGEGAATGFARKNGVDVSALETEVTPKGEYYALRRTVAGRATADILSETLPVLVTKIPWPKTMYWTGKDGVRFIRPVRWIAALLGDRIVEFSIANVNAGALSRGHRRLGADEIAFDHANYEERLEKNGVILSVERRKKKILDGIRKLLKGTGLTLVEDPALLSDLAYLTEYPTPILGDFNRKFLSLPSEVLTMVMRHHQRYFTLRDETGRMAPHFVAVMNLKADRKGFVKKGNERVLEARFNDARFFWEMDQQKPLSARVDDLKNVTFLAQLGTYYEKTERLVRAARGIAALLGADTAAAARAAELCKADLTTEMVKEFTDLQGIVGGLYAKAQGEPEQVWQAIYEHYQPLSMDGQIPSTRMGQILSLVDKSDTLTRCFSIGLAPTGSKDPFALRRAAQGIVKILVEGRMRLPLDLFDPNILEFLKDRMRYYFREVRGFAYDEVNAVMAGNPPDAVDAEARLLALREVRPTDDFQAVAAASKRVRNILKQANWQQGKVDEAALQEDAERSLWQAFQSMERDPDYTQMLRRISALRPQIDKFFDTVLVNAPDEKVRANRLALLGTIFTEFSAIADFSEIVTSS